jgi:hypothetical protein
MYTTFHTYIEVRKKFSISKCLLANFFFLELPWAVKLVTSVTEKGSENQREFCKERKTSLVIEIRTLIVH